MDPANSYPDSFVIITGGGCFSLTVLGGVCKLNVKFLDFWFSMYYLCVMTELLNFINRLNKLAALSGQQHGRFVLKINGQDYSRDVEYFRLSRIILTVWFIDNDTDKRHLLYKQDHSKPEGLEGKVMFVDFISSVLFDLLAIIVFTDEKRNFQDPKYGTDIEVIPVRNLILEGYGKDRTILLR